MNEKIINVAHDFSRFPFGRYKNQSDTSGEEFRDNLLLPSLEQNESVVVVLDGTQGYGSSFLEEAFGGLIRKGFDYSDARKKLKFVSNVDPTLPKEIDNYMKEAQEGKA